VRSTLPLHTRLSGASDARHSPRPLLGGREINEYLAKKQFGEIAQSCPAVIARAIMRELTEGIQAWLYPPANEETPCAAPSQFIK
jgi:hypothetical protein